MGPRGTKTSGFSSNSSRGGRGGFTRGGGRGGRGGRGTGRGGRGVGRGRGGRGGFRNNDPYRNKRLADLYEDEAEEENENQLKRLDNVDIYEYELPEDFDDEEVE